MTSEERRECFVYVTPPGSPDFVTAGRFELSGDSAGDARGRFVYGASYLARPDAVPLDPVELTLREGTFETRRLKGVFGAIRDASPDFWGRRVIEKHSGFPSLGEMDYLLLSPDDRAGALGFGTGKTPPSPLRRFNRTLDLEKLQTLADAILADLPSPATPSDLARVEDLLLVGTSMGGARPKAVVEDEEGLWIAKFNHPEDRWNQARVEHAMLELARRWVDLFEPFAAIVAPSPVCVAHVRQEMPRLLAAEPEWQRRAEAVAARTYELSEYLVDVLGVTRDTMGAQFDGTIAYQPACQQLRMVRNDDQARALLAEIEGAQLKPLADAESCCGFGGLFSARMPQLADAMAERKARAIEASGAQVVVTGETGCVLHMAGALERRGSACRAVHLAELLAGLAAAPEFEPKG